MGGYGRYIRRIGAVAAAAILLWAVIAPYDGTHSLREAGQALVLRQMSTQFPSPLSPAAVLVLQQSPQLSTAVYAAMQQQEETSSVPTQLPHAAPSLSPAPQATFSTLQFLDNGVPSQTVKITDPKSH